MTGYLGYLFESSDSSIVIEGGARVDFRVAAGAGAGFFIPPGANRTAAIETAILAGEKSLRFAPGSDGVYEIESQLFAGLTEAQVSDVRLVGPDSDPSIFRATYAPAIGLADDPDNALVLIQGAPDGAVNTTVAAGIAAMMGSATFAVTSAVGIVPDMWLTLIAHNNAGLPTDMLDMSDGAPVVLTELVQVLSVAGAVVTLKSPLKQWHTPGAAVASVRPVTNVTVRGIFFDCAGGSIATAITHEIAQGLDISECWLRGFSRAGFDLEGGSRDVRIEGIRARGELNSVLIGDSAIGVQASEIVCDTDVARFHPNGIARHAIKCFQRCTDWHIFDCLLQHMNAGVSWWGGVHLALSSTQIWDMDPARIRLTDGIEYPAGAALGVGLDGGVSPLGHESFGWSQRYADVEIHDCAGDVDDYGWFLHDARAVTIGGACGIYNHGPAWGTVVDGKTYRPQGFRCNDVQGIVESLTVHGCTFAFQTTGSPSLEIGQLRLIGTAGNGPGSIPFFLDHGGFSGLRIANLSVQNFNSAETFYFGAQFTLTPDWQMWIAYMNRDGEEWTDLSVYRSDVVLTQRAVAQVDAASPVGTKELVASTGPSSLNVAVANGAAANGFTLATLLPARYATIDVTGAGAAGALLEANAANQGIVNAAPAARTCIGRLTEAKAAGVAAAKIGTGPS